MPMPPELRDQVERKLPEERRKIEQVWDLLGYLDRDVPDVPGLDTAWTDLQPRLDAAPASRRPAGAVDRGPVRRPPWRAALGLSALALALLLGVWVWRQPVTVVVPAGAQRVVALSDGSTIHLNSTSQVRFRRGFRSWPVVPAAERRVVLDGEAFFDVVRGERPFVVETFNARVEVLGTQFNVRARQGAWEGETRVALAAGRVRVSAPQDPAYAVTLTAAGQTARVGATASGTAAAPAPAETMERVLAWRRQAFAVVDQPLASVLAEVERRFALSIRVEDGVALADSMTLFYPRGTTAEQIIYDICLSQQCRYRATSGGFVVFPADS